MKKGRNANHPKKGSRITVDPIRKIKDIKAISKLTSGNTRDHLLFVMGINNGLRACDLVKVQVGDIRYLAIRPNDDAYLFASRKGESHLQSQAVSKLVKKWTRAINLKGNYGAHTLRKTWGYIQRTVHGVGFEIICKRYNHSSPSIYLGIQDKEVHGVLMNEIG